MVAPPQSDLEHLLESNDPPHPSQTIRVRDILYDKQAVLSTLEDEISQLECALQALRNKRADVADEITQYSSILSPIRQLPAEIIGEIFLYFTPHMHRDTEHHTDTLTQVKLPWLLGHICRLWRTISLSLGQLWCVLDLGPPSKRVEYEGPRLLDFDDDETEFTKLEPFWGDDSDLADREDGDIKDRDEDAEGYEIETALEFIEECLQRSGRQPLSLRLWMHEFASLTILDALLRSSACWQELVLVLPSPALLDRLSPIAGGLQRLHKISFTTGYHPSDFEEFSYQFQSLQNITYLALSRIFIPDHHLHIPWSQLTQYSEIDCSWSTINRRQTHRERVASYRQLTNLTTFCLWTSFFTVTEPVVLPRLRVASFYTDSDTMRSFEMPVLEELSMDLSPRRVPFQVPSSPRLKILRVRINTVLSNPPNFAGDLERALELLPDLVELSVEFSDLITNTDISRLIPYNGQLPLAPKLEIIWFTNGSFIHESCKWTTLADMLQARFQPEIQGVSQLRSFELPKGYSVFEDDNVVAGLKALRARHHWNIRVDDECEVPTWDDLNA
ncbi:hypothetical protein DFH06DRAFT_456695 [Mycena polygramma]|nr:hypothetical protein DFH06DRAFT_456695 [Mycena polygramma]